MSKSAHDSGMGGICECAAWIAMRLRRSRWRMRGYRDDISKSGSAHGRRISARVASSSGHCPRGVGIATTSVQPAPIPYVRYAATSPFVADPGVMTFLVSERMIR